MSLQDIGFYTLNDERARNQSATSPLWRCELVLTDRCNFRCGYCRGLPEGLQGDLPFEVAQWLIVYWSGEYGVNLRLSGGEPTLWPGLALLVQMAKSNYFKRVAISTNGSASRKVYAELLHAGVDDFSISLDACCASVADKMAGCRCAFDRVIENIRFLSERAYVTVGIVLSNANITQTAKIIEFADSLGVADIRVIPAAQISRSLKAIPIQKSILDKHPILRYRLASAGTGTVRGLRPEDPHRCHLVRDDVAVAGKKHFPCIIYLREQGKPIGEIGPDMRAERLSWWEHHDPHDDPICSKNCLDVCREFNKKVEELQGKF